MRLVVFGSTGGVGRQFVDQALAAGHEVRAFARAPGKLEPREGLEIAIGNVFDAVAVDLAIRDRDAVLSSLGGTPFRTDRLCERAAGHMTAAMARHGVRRILCVSTHGAGDSRPEVDWFVRNVVFALPLRREVADKEAMERVLDASGLDWTAVRIGLLSNGPGAGAWRCADDGSLRGMGQIPRADVAAFMLQQVDRPDWVRRRPVLMT